MRATKERNAAVNHDMVYNIIEMNTNMAIASVQSDLLVREVACINSKNPQLPNLPKFEPFEEKAEITDDRERKIKINEFTRAAAQEMQEAKAKYEQEMKHIGYVLQLFQVTSDTDNHIKGSRRMQSRQRP